MKTKDLFNLVKKWLKKTMWGKKLQSSKQKRGNEIKKNKNCKNKNWRKPFEVKNFNKVKKKNEINPLMSK